MATFGTGLQGGNSHEGRAIEFLHIGKPGTEARHAAIIVAGLHSRELATPDAVLSFATQLLVAYDGGRPIQHPAIDVTYGPPPEQLISFPSFQLSAPSVKRIVEEMDVYIVPMANPDGRELALQFTNPALSDDEFVFFAYWRKNRNPATACAPSVPGNVATSANGVDLNRNFDIGWDFNGAQSGQACYHPDAANRAINEGRLSTVECPSASSNFQTFIGSGPVSENETKNVVQLIDSVLAGSSSIGLSANPTVLLFADVHMTGRDFIMPWTMEERGTDPVQSFVNPAFDGLRNGIETSVAEYKEWFPEGPNKLFSLHKHHIGGNLRWHIRLKCGGGKSRSDSRSRSLYTPVDGFHPTRGGATGTFKDFAFSRQITFDGTRAQLQGPPIIAYTFECGSPKQPTLEEDDPRSSPAELAAAQADDNWRRASGDKPSA